MLPKAFLNVGHTVRQSVFALVLGLLLVLIVAGCRRPPSDQDIQDLIKTVRSSLSPVGRDSIAQQATERVAQKALDGMLLEKASLSQLVALEHAGLLARVHSIRRAVAPRLSELAAMPDSNGAIAALMRVKNPTSVDDELQSKGLYSVTDLQAYEQLLTHAAVRELLKQNNPNAMAVFSSILPYDPARIRGTKVIQSMVPLIEGTISQSASEGAAMAFRSVASAIGDADPQLCERFRVVTIAQLQKAQALLSDAERAERSRGSSAWRLNYYSELLGAPFVSAGLLGKQAPNLDFIWSSDNRIRSLKQLKGKLVILDFWATWCAPCRATFPKIRALQNRYRDYPVVILGVTSIQGYQGQTNTEGDPTKEFNLMRGFMSDLNITWTVVFSKTNLFNPGFGVLAVPHQTIIDPSGKVRYNGLQQQEKAVVTANRIDAILKEFKLPFPGDSIQ